MKKVLVAMSGGVDSSVAAALLNKEGYQVTGGYMKNFSRESWEGVVEPDCPWQKDWQDVRKVCDKLGVDARVFNFEREYKDKVIDYFFQEYEAGRTPNPDVMCNREIKFRLFLNQADKSGFDYIATGHYAKIRRQETVDRPPRLASARLGRLYYELLKGEDSEKDQSYFLYTLTQQQLRRSLFPIGEYTKPQIRELAKKFNLPNAEKKDSVGICFVGEVDLTEFLKQRIPVREGQIVTTSGEVVGEHENAAYYTVGQRHGFGIGGIGPFYMVDKDMEKNLVIVTNQHDDKKLYSDGLLVKKINWINPETENRLPLDVSAQHRYRQKDQICRVERTADSHKVSFKNPQRAVTSGQSVVLYEGDKVLGGGVIEVAV